MFKSKNLLNSILKNYKKFIPMILFSNYCIISKQNDINKILADEEIKEKYNEIEVTNKNYMEHFDNVNNIIIKKNNIIIIK
jgi:hypothetical protein